ncbi:hypothetical protein JHK84_035501 [Glycine max]|nr:hypothetical protein JHK84_035501 [Glycine max]
MTAKETNKKVAEEATTFVVDGEPVPEEIICNDKWVGITLYYNNGIGSLSAEQIQRISARLRQYGISSASSFVEMVIVGRMRNYGYGSMPMEKSFRDCSISAGDSSGHVGINHNLGWVGVDPYNSSTHANFFDKIRPSDQETLEEEAENIGATKILACVHVHLRSNSVLGRTSVP